MLVIAADKELRAVIEMAVATNGRRVVGVARSGDAIEFLAGGGHADLIIADVEGETADPYALLCELRAHERTSPIPLIVLTNGDGATNRLEPRALAAVALRKPFDLNDLRERVREAIRCREVPVARDALTGLLARSQFEGAVEAALHAAQGSGARVAVVTIRVDDFESLTGRFGRSRGEHVLRCVSSIIGMHLRESDCAGRLSEDAFATLHAPCDARGAQAIAQRIVRAVTEDPQCAGVRVRFGVAVAAGTQNVNARHMLAQADEALRAAKNERA